MSFFNNLFGKRASDEINLPWQELTTENQLEDITTRSSTRPQIIFKHSTRCGISKMVINRFTASYNLSESQADLYYLDLLKYRSVSDAVAVKYGVEHQSPQVLVLKNGKVEQHASHHSINDLDFNK